MDRVSSIFDDDLRPRVRGYLEEASFCPAGRALYAAGSKGKFKVSFPTAISFLLRRMIWNRSSSPTTRSPAFSLTAAASASTFPAFVQRAVK